MCEPLFRQQVVRLDGAVDILSVDTDGDAHEHVLWALDGPSVNL